MFLAVYTLLSVLLFDPKVSVGGDNAVYLMLAESIVEGKGYVQLHLPDEPAHTNYPLGFPVLLSLVHILSGGVNVLGAKLLVVLAGIVAVFFMYGICEHLFKKKAWVVMAFLVSIPMLVSYNNEVLTEIPFLCFSMGTIYFLLKARPARKRFYWFAFGFAICALLLRTAGISLVLGVMLFLLFKKQYKYLGIFALLFVLAFVPWQIRNAKVGQEQTYLEQLLAKNPYIAELGKAGVLDLVVRVWRNFVEYCFFVLPIGLLPLLEPGVVSWIVGSVFAALVIVGFVRRAKNRSVIEAYSILAVIVLLGWPGLWAGERFLLPLVPVLVIYIFVGLFWLERKVRWKYIVPALAGILVLLNGIEIGRMAGAAIRNNIRYLNGDRYAGYTQDWCCYFEAIEWIDKNIPEDRVVLARKPEFVYLLSGHKSFCYPFTHDHAEVRAAIDKSDYILFDNFQWTNLTLCFLNPVLREEPDRYRAVYKTGSPAFFVLEVAKD